MNDLRILQDQRPWKVCALLSAILVLVCSRPKSFRVPAVDKQAVQRPKNRKHRRKVTLMRAASSTHNDVDETV